MNTQPETLRLADLLDALMDEETLAGASIIDKAAIELRRLHEANQELLKALHSISLASQDSGSTREGMGLYARTAIAKATGGQHD